MAKGFAVEEILYAPLEPVMAQLKVADDLDLSV
jgi:hypothetical protein